MKNIRVILVPKYLTKEELREAGIRPTATVEAEYGSEVIYGDEVTLAHHTPQFQNHPAPCNTENVPKLEDGATIVISHIDLDTLGGIAALMGRKAENPEFWKVAEFIDLNGPHHLFEVPESARDRYVAYEAYGATHRTPRYTEPTDVTELVMEHLGIVDRAVRGEAELVEEGRTWERETTEKIEECLVFENENVRVFNSPEGTFCAASYYSPNLGKIVPATVTFNGRFKSVTVAMADGGKELGEKTGESARTLVQALWGNEAGGHAGIAGSPRAREMNEQDMKNLAKLVNEKFNEARGTSHEMTFTAPTISLGDIKNAVEENKKKEV